MNTHQTISPVPVQWRKNKPAMYGLALIAFAILFWIAVLLEQLFHNNWLVENIVVKIDSTSSLLSLLLCMVFPIIALLINLISVLNFNFKNEKKEWIAEFRIRPAIANTAIIIFCMMNTFMLMAYLLTENYSLVAR